MMVDWVGREVEITFEFDGIPAHAHGFVIAQDWGCSLYEVKFPRHAAIWLRPGWLTLA